MLSKYRRRWRNWSGSVEAVPNYRSYPTSLEEIQAEVLRAAEEGERVRVGGSGQSFTPLCWTDENLMSLDYFTGIESADLERRRVWVRSGTRLQELAELLAERGLAQEALGTSGKQTLAGAISTGTHGTGVKFGSMSTQVTGLKMVCADGSVKTLGADSNRDLFDAARLSLGALGVITHVELQCVDAYRLYYRTAKGRLDDTLARLELFKRSHRHFEFCWFPYSESVQLKFMDVTDAAASRPDPMRSARSLLVDNGALWALSEVSRHLPRSSEAVSRLAAWGAATTDVVGPPHQRFATRRVVRFNETEFAIPAERLPAVLRQLDRLIRALRFRTHLPLEVRFVKADEIWLSPCYQRDTAFISVRVYKGVPYEDYFGAVMEIFDRHDGRPHWGKIHDKTAHDLAHLYPRFADFQRLRSELDPRGVFLNPHLATILGVEQR